MEMDNEQLTRFAAILAATMRANQELLSVLIATHPEPDVLNHVWEQSKPGFIDEEADAMFFNVGAYKDAYLARLSGISGEINGAAEQFATRR